MIPFTQIPLLTTRILRLESIVVLLACSTLGLVAVFAYQVWHGPFVYVIPPGNAGLAQPGVIPDTAATAFAAQWLTLRYTFMPDTVKQVQDAMVVGLHPRLHPAFRLQTEGELKLIRETQLSSQLVPLTTTVLSRTPETVVVSIGARRMIWVGGQQTREESLQAELTVGLWVAPGTPYGLVITRVVNVPRLSALEK